MDNRTAWLVDVPRDLIARHPARAHIKNTTQY